MTKFVGTVDINNNAGGSEGGELQLSVPSSNSTLSGPVKIDIYENKLRFFEGSGSARGAYIDLTATGSSAGTNLLGTSGAMNYAQTTGTKQSNISASGTTIVSVSITTNGYPVQVVVTGDVENNSAGGWTTLQLYRGSTAIGNIVHTEGSAGSENVPYALTVIDTPSAGTYTYALKLNSCAGGTFNFGESNGPVITAIELAGKTGATGATGASGATTLDGLTDVTAPSPSAGEYLAFNGSAWVNSSISIEDISEISLSSPSNGQFLKWNGTAWVNDVIDLATDTAGNYVSSLVAGTGITLTNNSGEAATPTIAIGQAVGTTSNVTFGSVNTTSVGQNGNNLNINGTDVYINTGANLYDDNGTVTIGGSLTVTSAINGVLSVGTQAVVFEGATQDAYQTTLEAVDPTADRTITFPNASGTVELSEVLFNQQTATYTLTLGDKSKMVEMNVGSANILYVPTNASVAFPVGTTIDILQTGSGKTQIAAVSSGTTTINSANGAYLRAQWSAATLVKRATDTWVLFGDTSTS